MTGWDSRGETGLTYYPVMGQRTGLPDDDPYFSDPDYFKWILSPSVNRRIRQAESDGRIDGAIGGAFFAALATLAVAIGAVILFHPHWHWLVGTVPTGGRPQPVVTITIKAKPPPLAHAKPGPPIITLAHLVGLAAVLGGLGTFLLGIAALASIRSHNRQIRS